MEKMQPRDISPEQAPVETLSDADAWARIESIQPGELAAKLEGLLSDENVQRAKQAEVNRYTAEIRTTSSVGDREEITQSIAKAKQREEEILKQVSAGNGRYAELDMRIRSAKVRGLETKPLEDEMAELIKELAPLQGEYEKVCTQLDWLQGSSVMLEALANKQAAYIANETQAWELSTEYKAAFGQLALALERIDKLPQLLPIPTSPPDMASQNPTDTLPLSLDGQLEDKRQVFTVDIQQQIDKMQESKDTQEHTSPTLEKQSEPQVFSYQQLAAILPATKISIPVKRRSRINELMKEDAKV
jgi:hypothetical protein